MEPEEEGCAGVPISISMYSSTKDSMRSEYVSVPSRSPSTESTRSQVHVELNFCQNSACDSGYSELDICSVGDECKENLPGINENFSQFSIEAKVVEPTCFEMHFPYKIDKETQTMFLNNAPIFSSCADTVLEDLELCFNLDRLVEPSEEETYFEA